MNTERNKQMMIESMERFNNDRIRAGYFNELHKLYSIAEIRLVIPKGKIIPEAKTEIKEPWASEIEKLKKELEKYERETYPELFNEINRHEA